MKKLSGIICDSCRTLIRSNTQMTNKDWEAVKAESLQLCPKCEAPVRLDELERSKDLMNSDYYWRRKKELESISNGEKIEEHSTYYYNKDRNKPIKLPTTQTSSNEKDGEDWNNTIKV